MDVVVCLITDLDSRPIGSSADHGPGRLLPSQDPLGAPRTRRFRPYACDSDAGIRHGARRVEGYNRGDACERVVRRLVGKLDVRFAERYRWPDP